MRAGLESTFSAIIAAAMLAGCGGGGSTATHRTITESARQANVQAAATTAPPANTDYLIICGHGVQTNGSCVFADEAASAIRQAGGQPGLVVMRFADGTVNPLTCARHGRGLRCKSRRSAVWVQVDA